jgi:L-arabinonolactonase
MSDVHCVQAANALLGEGPIWDSRVGVLYWIDIQRPAVFRFDPILGQTGLWPLTRPIGCVATAYSECRLVFADADGLGFLNLSTGEIERIASPESELPGNRFNDGKVDRHGRLWAGTMHSACKESSGSLYRLDSDGCVRRMATGFICSNGLGWSPDDRIMYFTDSMRRTIWAYEFNSEEGEIGERYVFATFFDDDGVPDGLTVDVQGFVWCAVWDGWRVVRFAPDGKIDREIRMPVQRPSSCTFGGPDLKTLYLTSASVELDWNAIKRGPLAGGLFALECDVGGVYQTPFGA